MSTFKNGLLGAAITALTITVGLVAFTNTASANVLNPSFEIGSASLPNSCGAGCSYSVSGTGASPDTTTIPDWTISPFTQGAGVYVPNAATGLTPVPDGSAVAFTSGGSISQDTGLQVIDGHTYTLTAWIAPSYNKFVQAAEEYIGITGVGTGPISASATGLTLGEWTQVSLSWTATNPLNGANPQGQEIYIVLFNQGGAGQAQFDDISFADASAASGGSDVSATPLPAALPLFAGGLGVIGLIARGRKRNGSSAIASA